MELIPAIDLRGGRVVRLLRGDDARRTEYAADPVAVLDEYAAAGIARVHVVDLDAAFGEPPQREAVARLVARAREAGVELQLGGGLRNARTVGRALAAGCSRAVVGSLVASDPKAFAEIADRYPGQLVPALDALAVVDPEAADGSQDYVVRVAGWTKSAGRSLVAICGALRGLPCPAVLVTDIGRDGTLEGANLELARRVSAATGLPALLSGGVRSPADLALAAQTPGIAGAIVGRALYEGRFTLAEGLAACRGEAAE